MPKLLIQMQILFWTNCWQLYQLWDQFGAEQFYMRLFMSN